MAALLGIDNKGRKNGVLKRIENVRKIDVRVKGRSTLEPSIWSDLDDNKNYNIGKKVKLHLLDMKKEESDLDKKSTYITVEETMILFQKKLLI